MTPFTEIYPFLYLQTIFGLIFTLLIINSLQSLGEEDLKRIKSLIAKPIISFIILLIIVDRVTDHQTFLTNFIWTLAPAWGVLQSKSMKLAGIVMTFLIAILLQDSYQGVLPNEWYPLAPAVLFFVIGIFNWILAPKFSFLKKQVTTGQDQLEELSEDDIEKLIMKNIHEAS